MQHNKNTEGLELELDWGSSQYLLAEASAGVGDGAGTAMEGQVGIVVVGRGGGEGVV
jgi:hypothetical protein